MTSTDTDRPHHVHPYQPGTMRAAWSYPMFRIFFVASALSNVGSWMQNFTLPAYLDGRTGSAGLVGLLVFTQLGPHLLLSVPGGVLADRVDRTKLVTSMQIAMMLSSAVLAVLVGEHAPVWTLFATQLVLGTANALQAPAFSASIPMLVDRHDLSGAVSLNSAMLNVSRISGPALAALLSAVGLSTAQLFAVNAATFLILILPLVTIGLPSVRVEHAEQGWRRLMTGFNIARRRAVVGRVLTSMTLFSVCSLAFIGLFPSVARLNFGLDATGPTFKWLYVVWGLGGFFGAVAVGSWMASLDKLRLIPYGFVGFAVTLAAFAVVRSPGPAFPVGFALGFSYFVVATSLITVLQQNLADRERGAVMPLWFMSWGGSVPLGNMLAGPVIDRYGARPVLLAGAAAALALARWADLRRLPPEAFLEDEAA